MADSAKHPIGPSRLRQGRIKITLLVLFAIGIVCTLSLWWLWWMTRCPISTIEPTDIASARWKLFKRESTPTVFAIERELIPDVLAALKPCQLDWNPAAWQVLGELEINMKDGSRLCVGIYTTGERHAAFSINRWYYRGGSERDLKRALRSP
jgi:hypothetical protein